MCLYLVLLQLALLIVPLMGINVYVLVVSLRLLQEYVAIVLLFNIGTVKNVLQVKFVCLVLNGMHRQIVVCWKVSNVVLMHHLMVLVVHVMMDIT